MGGGGGVGVGSFQRALIGAAPRSSLVHGELETTRWVCSSPGALCALTSRREVPVSGERLAVRRGGHRPRDPAAC